MARGIADQIAVGAQGNADAKKESPDQLAGGIVEYIGVPSTPDGGVVNALIQQTNPTLEVQIKATALSAVYLSVGAEGFANAKKEAPEQLTKL